MRQLAGIPESIGFGHQRKRYLTATVSESRPDHLEQSASSGEDDNTNLERVKNPSAAKEGGHKTDQSVGLINDGSSYPFG